MSEDLVDQLVRERKSKEESESREQDLALLRSRAVEQNSDFVWLEIIKATRTLIEKYNRAFPGAAAITMSEGPGSPPQGFDVERPLSPIARLFVQKSNPHFIEFSIMRASRWGEEENLNGRIDIKADNDRKVFFLIEGKPKQPPKDVAEYLLKPVFDQL